MSGSPKWVEAIIISAVLAGIESARLHRANVEEQARADAALQQRLFHAQRSAASLLDEAEQLYNQIQLAKAHLSPAVEIRLSDQLSGVIQSLRHTTDYLQVSNLAPEVAEIRRELIEARDEQQEQALAAQLALTQVADERYLLQLNQLTAELERLKSEGGAELDSRGRKAALDALNDARIALKGSDEVKRDYQLRHTASAINQHRNQLQRNRDHQAELARRAQQHIDEFEQLLVGLRADETLMRWQGAKVNQLAQTQIRLQELAGQGELSALEKALADARVLEQTLVAQANAAQLKADQRDYIAASIHQVLEGLGFVSSEVVEEHPGHPASALLISAHNAQGQALSVSVPAEGEVWYDVDGYALGTASRVGGGTAAVCDEAEAVIDEMHEALEAQFSIQTGELMWEHKDPDRILRTANELPQDGQSRGGEDAR